MGYVEGANASNLQCLEYLSQDKCLSSLHKGLCSNPCVQVSVYKGSQWALFVATHEITPEWIRLNFLIPLHQKNIQRLLENQNIV